jgi:acyl transferase domain-containing protein/NAD(P)H-dependent flavin oxidoreductase YrpB (nitropropane dioxygenase family)/NADP-dependent 3-hydroxy acid dehydrogenase YdfG
MNDLRSDDSGLRFDVLALSPFERPDERVVAAACRAGALGVLDLGRDPTAARAALAALADQGVAPFGVRIPAGAPLGLAPYTPETLPSAVDLVVLEAATDADLAPWRARAGLRVAVQVTCLGEARAALAGGATALVAKGSEAGGRVGEETSFVLLQHLVADPERPADVPVWVQGGVGLHTAAACAAGGAAGVVLDSQLALLREARTPAALAAALRSMDGSETAVLAHHRVLSRPGTLAARLADPAPAEPAAPDALVSAVRAALGGTDLATRLVPAGQDAAFARPFAERFRSVAGVVTGLRAAVAAHLRDARVFRPLEPGAPLAAAWGTDYPIAQGPMSRVSDNAPFAAAVAEGGGLPFLAVSIATGETLTGLLRATAAALAGRPWGAGLLGFVPPALREEQLAALLALEPAVRPRAALIAGGRPAQARPLEEAGIETWLHVPSPGLLDLFLKEGARRFVFEGRECGGHVGPRSSFVLWEAQLERLLAFDGPAAELGVLFAGGVHDERSAAMVAALAAPLAARGVRVGVLMGTAYLFTPEAVATGAIQPAFQQEALACGETTVLETVPGHATRCVPTEYARFFATERARLVAAGRPAEEVWATLEQLNLGRLRIAAKGERNIDPVTDAGAPVGEDVQRREGLYMIGQVAALRDRLIPLAELHRAVSAGATEFLAERAAAVQPPPAVPALPEPPPVDVAVIGMACLFPGAQTLGDYWANVVHGADSVGEVPPERWNQAIYFDPESHGGGKSASKWGGFLADVPFDPLAYGIPPKSLTAIEPVQLLSLEVSRRALDDAGYGEKSGRAFDRERTAVIFGAEAGTDLAGAYGFRGMLPQYTGTIPPELDAVLPRLSEDSFAGILANVVAGRVANRLDLGGPNFTVDAACASSLAAVDLCVKELVSGTSDMALCGGADLHNSLNDYLLFSSVHALSRTGPARTFDADADGTTIGEGIAVVVLKRLADAQRDGDRVYAVIKGVGAASDGKSLGLTAPRQSGQERALERAFRRAHVTPRAIGLVEAHGTGTVVGDKVELAALTEVFVRDGVAPGSVALGSVKSQIGHTKCAAGMAGLIKTALALYHGVKPPTLHVRTPNPYWKRATSPFVFHRAARPWPARERRAGLSAFGFGGTNFHAVLEAPPDALPADVAVDRWPAELFLFRGRDRAAAAERVALLESLLAEDQPWRLRDLARAASCGGDGPVQVAVVASDLDDLRGKLARARGFERDPRGVFVTDAPQAGDPAAVAFLFPGQGSQRPGMLADLFVAFPPLQRWLRLGERWLDRLYPGAAFSPDEEKEQQAAVTDTRVAQPTLGMADRAMADLLLRCGVRPALAGGHSYGELVALALAGALPDDELLALSEARAEAILAAAAATGGDPGTMAAVPASPDATAGLLVDHPDVVLANQNAPNQTVISGPTAAVERAVEALAKAGVKARRLPVACAFHSPVVAGASALFAERLTTVAVAAPAFPVWSNTTAAPYPAVPDAIRTRLALHVSRPVRFAEQIEQMYAAGARVFVEAGPGRVLTGLVDAVLGDRPHVAVACDAPGKPGLAAFLGALAELAVHGVPLDTDALFAGRDVAAWDLSAPLRPQLPKAAWWVNGQYARPVHGPLPEGAYRPVSEPVLLGLGGAAPAAAAGAAGTRDGVVLEYLQTMRKLVDTQRDVMLSYLGTPVPLDLQPSQPAAAATATTALAPAHGAGRGTALAVAPGVDVLTDPEGAPGGDKLASLVDLLLGIVSERTGYPLEMLQLDLDLEADLSIDSIKRIEILGALSIRIGVDAGDGAEALIEELARLKTLRGIVSWLEERPKAGARLPAAAGPLEEPEAAPTVVPEPAPAPAPELPPPLTRYVVATADLPAPPTAPLAERPIAVFGAGREPRAGIAPLLAERLRAAGAAVSFLDDDAPLNGAATVVDLSPLCAPAGYEPAKAVYQRLRAAAERGAGLVAVTGLGGRFGLANGNGPDPDVALPMGGVGALLKSVARERPEWALRAVDVDPADPPEVIAAAVAQEIAAADDAVEVGWSAGTRRRLTVRPAPLPGDAPPVDPLDRDSVVLLTGGARGITARIAAALAERWGCRLELVGRSPRPAGEEAPAFAAAADLTALRRLLLERGAAVTPKDADAQARRLLAEREIRATLATIRAAGGEVRYHAADVRDPAAFGRVIDDVYAHHGRLDGVVHGAGVIEDRLFADKTPESFDRVFDTKVHAARTLVAKLRPGLRFLVFFGSVAGAFGNRGQADYAAANEALDKLAHALNGQLTGRVLSIDWGPWKGAGMVDPALEREYARRGVGLIDVEEGVRAFLDELAWGPAEDAQVVWMAAAPEALGA